MKNILFLFLFFPILLFSQENRTKKNANNKVDAYSGATYYNQVKGTIAGKIKDSDNNSLESIFLTTSEFELVLKIIKNRKIKPKIFLKSNI